MYIYPVGCRDLHICWIKISTLQRVSSLLEHVIYSTSVDVALSVRAEDLSRE